MKTKVMGHRGARGLAPENTIDGMKLAWRLGVDMIETDVYLTKDNVIVLCHDDDVFRTAGVHGKLIDMTFGELRSLDFGSSFNKYFAGAKIPTLKEALDIIPEGKMMAVEVKDYRPELIPHLEDVLNECGAREKVRLISFSLDAVENCKKRMPDIDGYYLMYTFDKIDWEAQADFVQSKGIDGFCIEPFMFNDEAVKAFRDRGMVYNCGVTNEADLARKMRAYEPGWICTDRPDIVLEALEDK